MERDRQRRLSVEGRLADLGGRVPDDDPPSAPDLPPTWGPIGSLAEKLMQPVEFAHLLALHEDMLALERMRRGDPRAAPAPAPAAPAPVRESSPPVVKPGEVERVISDELGDV